MQLEVITLKLSQRPNESLPIYFEGTLTSPSKVLDVPQLKSRGTIIVKSKVAVRPTVPWVVCCSICELSMRTTTG
jgi:hypothetical protein